MYLRMFLPIPARPTTRRAKGIATVLACLCYSLCHAQSPSQCYQGFAEGYAALDARAVTSQYAHDGVLINLYPDREPVSYAGQSAIQAFFEEAFAAAKADGKSIAISFKITDRQRVGGRVLDNGYYQLAVTGPDGQSNSVYGKLSAVLRKDGGRWKFSVDANATATPMAYRQAEAIGE